MARFLRRWPSVWCAMRSWMNGRWRRCGGCIGIPRADRWWRWSRGRGCSRRVWPDSSACGTARVAPPTVMRRFGIGITPHRATAAGRPVPPMGWASANGATTPRKRRAGASPRRRKRCAHGRLRHTHRRPIPLDSTTASRRTIGRDQRSRNQDWCSTRRSTRGLTAQYAWVRCPFTAARPTFAAGTVTGVPSIA